MQLDLRSAAFILVFPDDFVLSKLQYIDSGCVTLACCLEHVFPFGLHWCNFKFDYWLAIASYDIFVYLVARVFAIVVAVVSRTRQTIQSRKSKQWLVSTAQTHRGILLVFNFAISWSSLKTAQVVLDISRLSTLPHHNPTDPPVYPPHPGPTGFVGLKPPQPLK